MMLRLALPALLLTTVAPISVSAQEREAVVTAQVDDLTSIREIKRLQARWGHLALSGDWESMAALATEDAELAMRYGVIEGRGGLEAWLKSTQGHGVDGMPQGRMNVRLYLSPVITLAGDGQSATGRWHEIAMTAEVGEAADWLDAPQVLSFLGQNPWFHAPEEVPEVACTATRTQTIADAFTESALALIDR